ncbi:hypothetical protein GW17_00030698 [Ensete ventricosum]|nr:hypothetical protein GW17_00030698 [Ensete ventricosum]RZR89853.1 hypothetical protein BHM03_00017693 [Ensete ventricosum]
MYETKAQTTTAGFRGLDSLPQSWLRADPFFHLLQRSRYLSAEVKTNVPINRRMVTQSYFQGAKTDHYLPKLLRQIPSHPSVLHRSKRNNEEEKVAFHHPPTVVSLSLVLFLPSLIPNSCDSFNCKYRAKENEQSEESLKGSRVSHNNSRRGR